MVHAASQPVLLEWLLNALWLLLVLAAASAAHRKVPPGPRRMGRAIALVALGCAATILFPAISLSDDLYDQQWAIEDSGLRIKKPERAALGTAQPALPGFHIAVGLAPARRAVEMLTEDENANTPYSYVLPVAQRAPPQAPH